MNTLMRQSASMKPALTASKRLDATVACRAGKHVLITGGNTGIGYEAALSLACSGNDVVIACRDESKAQNAVSKIKSSARDAKVSYVLMDLSDLRSVKAASTQLLDMAPFDVLLNNAGIMAPPNRLESAQGQELQLAVNHFGHFALTMALLPSLKAKATPSRIINVASTAHLFGAINFDDLQSTKRYSAWADYGRSKLANVMFSYELDRMLAGSNITVNALHPGVVATELFSRYIVPSFGILEGPVKALSQVFLKSPAQGASTSIFLASDPSVEGISGKYWVDCKEQTSSKASYDRISAKRLFEVSQEICDAKL
jgi:retinol dehydrogenase-12